MTYIAHLPFLPQSNVKLGICVIEKTFAFLSAMLFWYSLQPSLELGILWKTYFVRKYQFLWKVTWTEDRIKDSIQFEIIFFSSTHNYGYSTDLSVLAILPWSSLCFLKQRLLLIPSVFGKALFLFHGTNKSTTSQIFNSSGNPCFLDSFHTVHNPF